jgi:hypothetical protein
MKLQRIGIASAAKLGGVIYCAMGLVFGALFSLFSVIGAAASSVAGESGAWGLLFGVGAIVVLPIFYGAIGFIGMAIGAWIYNLAAGWIGGLELELSDG